MKVALCFIISYEHILNKEEIWKTWNVTYHKRANLQYLPKEFHLGNDPWFVMKRENVLQTMQFVKTQQSTVKTICDGGLANESLFAIIMYAYKQMESNGSGSVISAVTHLTDWSRMMSATSPYLFKDANGTDIKFIDTELEKNKYAMFIRKMAPEFPDDVLRNYIYEKNKHRDDALVIIMPPLFIYLKIKYYLYYFGLPALLLLYSAYYFTK